MATSDPEAGTPSPVDDLNKDPSFYPPSTPARSKPPTVKTTPTSRQTGKTPRLHDIGTRVRIDDPNKRRCLVTNYNHTGDVELSHCVDRAVMENNDTMMSNIEWWWGMRHRSLHLDTRWNVICLSASIHTLFDKEYFVLLPSQAVVKKYFDTVVETGGFWVTDRKKFQKIPDGVFEYDFVALDPSLRKRVIHRQDDLVDSPSANDFTAHLYPYQTLKLKSHLHPRFAVLAAGFCVAQRAKKAFDNAVGKPSTGTLELEPNELERGTDAHRQERDRLYQIDERLSQVRDISRAWTSQRPSFADDDKDYIRPIKSLPAANKPTRSGVNTPSEANTPSERPSVVLHLQLDGPSASKKSRTG